MQPNIVRPEDYWEHAGRISYAEAMFASPEVEQHVNRRGWQMNAE
jgi:hypothetical protein